MPAAMPMPITISTGMMIGAMPPAKRVVEGQLGALQMGAVSASGTKHWHDDRCHAACKRMEAQLGAVSASGPDAVPGGLIDN